MQKVTASRDVEFPKLEWSIREGEEKELPEGKRAQEAILAHFAISPVEEKRSKKKEA